MQKYTVLLFPLFTIFYSCQQETTYNRQDVDSLYAIQTAHYMEKTNELNENASLQFQDTYREIYLIVLHEEKGLEELTLEEYYKFTKDKLEENGLQNLKFSEPKTMQIDSNKVMQAEFTGTFSFEDKEEKETKEIGVFYLFQVIESPTYFYQIYAWTKMEQREKYEKDMQKMLDSFEEIL